MFRDFKEWIKFWTSNLDPLPIFVLGVVVGYILAGGMSFMDVITPISTEFVGFPKISRYSREIICTEKIDGTNGCIYIREDKVLMVGSRTRWITRETDNHGFANWAYDHIDELMTLGPGRHFGEWWGYGIQRGYNLPKGDKRFSLFNVTRWCLHGQTPQQIPCGDPRTVKFQTILPACVGLVPVLWRESFDNLVVSEVLDCLVAHGSYASPGYMQPEGVVIHHVAGNVSFKKTIEKDSEPKGNG